MPEYLMLGRQYCPRCDIVRTVVRHPEVVEMLCPRCSELTQAARGPDNLRPRSLPMSEWGIGRQERACR